MPTVDSPIVALLVTAPLCHFCAQAHEVLNRLAREGLPLRIDELGWDDEGGTRLVRHDGVPFPPALYLDGVLWAYGRISERALRKQLTSMMAST